MDQTIAAAAWQSGVSRSVSDEQDAGAAAGQAAATPPDAAGAPGTPTAGPSAREAGVGPVVVGAIPQQPSGFQPRLVPLARLNRADRGASVVRLITGVPGVGKTQLAAAYARAKVAARWRLVAWVNAADTGSLLAGLAAAADAMGLSGGDPGRDAADAGRAVRQRLEADGERCLLVFDDMEDPDVVRPYVPVEGAVQVLITTSRQSVADLGSSVPVDVFSDEEALAFLDGRTGLGEAGAAALAAGLGHLPLPLAQAAAVTGKKRLAYNSYRRRLQALRIEKYLTPEPDHPYPRGVAEAVLLAFDAARAADQVGVCAKAMALTAVLSAAGVGRELLHAAAQAGALATDGRQVATAKVDQALERLADWSLLTFSLDGQTVIVHPLVTRVMRETLARQGELTMAYRGAAWALEVRTDALAGSADRSAFRDLAQQMTVLLDRIAGTAAEADAELARVLLRLRFLRLNQLIRLGDNPQQAIAFGKQLTADLERAMGRDHPDALNARRGLAAAYRSSGLSAIAMVMLQVILFVREREQGPDHPDTLTSRSDLAGAYREAGQVARAIPLFKQNLDDCERLLGPDHPRTLSSRNNLALAHGEAGRAAEAIPLFERNLAACERLLGDDDPRTLSARRNLAAAYQDAGQPEQAARLSRPVPGTENPPARLVDQVGGDFQGDRAQLVRVVDLLEVDVTGRADR